MRISFSRRSQSMASFTLSPSLSPASAAGTWMISSFVSPVMVAAIYTVRPSASVSRPVSPGCPPDVA